MLTRIIAAVAFSAVSAVMARAGCFPATGNRIVGGELALADARFAAMPSTLTIGFAPAPGTRRVFGVTELQRIARSNGIQTEGLTEVCFEVAMRFIRPEEAVTAMRRGLPTDATLKLIELRAVEVPEGRIEFPLNGLEPALESNHGVQLWRGDVLYAETRRVSIWARVEVTTQYKAVIAARDLLADTPIEAASLRLETRTGPLERQSFAGRIEDVQGRVAKRAIKAGSVFPVNVLEQAPAVRRGDAVPVEVQSGPAQLRFEAIAENTARGGELVELRNPLSGKTFRARLNQDGKAVIIINAGDKL